MFGLFAVYPGEIRSKRDLISLFERFEDPVATRFIYQAPNPSWEKMILASLAEMRVKGSVKPVESSRFTRRLQRLKEQRKMISATFSLSANRDEITDKNGHVVFPSHSQWLEKIRAEAQRKGVLGYLVGDEFLDVSERLFSWEDPESEPPENWTPDQSSFKQNEEGYLRVLGPLINYSEQFFLIDPYATPLKNSSWRVFEPILRAILLFMSDTCPPHSKRCLQIHCGVGDNDRDQRPIFGLPRKVEEMKGELLEGLSSNISLKFRAWTRNRPDFDNEQAHNRYFFTERGGIKFGDSLQKKAAKDEASPLTLEVLRRLRSLYVDATDAPFESADT